MNTSNILSKIKDYYGFKKDIELANFLGISPQALYNWKKRNSYDLQLIYSKCPEINPEWLLAGTGAILKRRYSENEFKNSIANEFTETYSTNHSSQIPIFDLDNSEGLSNLLKNKNSSSFLNIPNITNSDGACYVKGDSMEPLFKSGDIVIFKVLPIESIFFGGIYLLEIDLGNNSSFTSIRHINKSDLGDEYIKLTSTNSVYEPKDVSLKTVKLVATINSSVRFH